MIMRQLVVLCLLACIARSCTAEEAKPQGYEGPDHYRTKEEYEHSRYGHDNYRDYDRDYHREYDQGNYREYDQGDYKEYDDEYPSDPNQPRCGRKTFPELSPPSCIDPHTGKLNQYPSQAALNSACKINATQWCKPLPIPGNYSCTYQYKEQDVVCRHRSTECDEVDVCDGKSAKCVDTFKPSGHRCRDAEGDCDVADFCLGNSTVCPDKVFSKDVTCRVYENPCIKDSKCDGVVKFCPGKHKVATGTPCNHHGVYDEVHDEYGQVELMSSVTEAKAKKHGWSVCHRCYKGECKQFKWEWWKTEKHGKHHHHHEEKKEEDKYDDKAYSEPEEEYHHEEEEEYYPTKSDYSAGLEGYEPEFYCKKHEYA